VTHTGVSVDTKPEAPTQTQIPVQIQTLIRMRDSLHNLLSRRVFLVGGGYAPGQNGAPIVEGTPPTKIVIDNKFSIPGTLAPHDQVYLPAIPNLASNASTSGQPGGWTGVDTRIVGGGGAVSAVGATMPPANPQQGLAPSAPN
jgi:hypothetical protein